MDFAYNEDQRLLADSLRRFIDRRYTVEHRRQVTREQDGFCRESWQFYANLGMLGLTIPEAYGGFFGTAADTFVVQYEAGRGLLLEPIIPSCVISAGIIRCYGTEAQKQDWLPAIADGSKVLTVAYQELGSRYDIDAPSATATRHGNGYRIDGCKRHVWHGGAADAFIVSAWNLDLQSVSLFIVPSTSVGVSVRDYPTMDSQRAAEVVFQSVQLAESAMLRSETAGVEMLQMGLDQGVAALCAASVGAMERLIDMTSEYLRSRKQFGQPLASFQALRHRMADMLVQKELALSMAHLAASAVESQVPLERRRKISAAKAIVGKAGRFIGQQAIQLHGGMGVTAELAVGDYFKFLTMMDPLLGDTDHHTSAFASLLDADA